MKKLIWTAIAVLLALYGLCYIDMHGTDNLPTIEEYIGYVTEKKIETVETFCTIRDWLTEHGWNS